MVGTPLPGLGDQAEDEEELKRCYCIRRDTADSSKYIFTQQSCCPRTGDYRWACASTSTGVIQQSDCTTYGNGVVGE